MQFTVTILGNNSALPSHGRHPTAQVVSINQHQYLIDAGEGVQMQIKKYKVKKSKIHHIFISHLHGDHYFGLIGLINSMGLEGRTKDLHIYAPALLEEIIRLQLQAANTQLPFQLNFHLLKSGQNGTLLKEKNIEISFFPTNHRIDCFGFLFREIHEERKILPQKVQKWDIPYTYYSELKAGKDFITKEGKRIKNTELTAPPSKNHSYAFCADTKYEERLIPFIYQADLVYHEATYLHDEVEKAESRFHSTAMQAALLAKRAQVKRLLLGHFSSRYKDLDPFEKETREIFAATEVSKEGTTYFVKNEKTNTQEL